MLDAGVGLNLDLAGSGVSPVVRATCAHMFQQSFATAMSPEPLVQVVVRSR